jgi:hypothetical protein
MSFLRRRIARGPRDSTPPDSSDTSTESSPARPPHPDELEHPDRLPEHLRVVSLKKLEKLRKNSFKSPNAKGTKRRNAWVFGLGGLFGVAVAAFFAQSNEMLDLPALPELHLESILEALPAGFMQDARSFQVCGFLARPLRNRCVVGALAFCRSFTCREHGAGSDAFGRPSQAKRFADWQHSGIDREAYLI